LADSGCVVHVGDHLVGRLAILVTAKPLL
jgi:hypothetical protein